MYKDGVVTIEGFAKGQANSPYSGFASIVGCEVFDPAGIIKMSNRTVNRLTVNQVTVGEVTDPFGNVYTLNQTEFYKNYNPIQGFSFAYDLVYYQNYILVRTNSSLSAYGPVNSVSAAWHDSFITGFDPAYYGKLLSGTVEDVNGAVYIGNGINVATLKQVNGKVFDPTDATTYTIVMNAYTINNGYAVTFAEINDLLAIGVQQGTSWGDRVNHTTADIHYWDRSSSKADSIVHLMESGIHCLIGKDNRIFAVAGGRGNVYETDTTNYQMIAQIPWNNNRSFGTSMMAYPNAITFNGKGNMLVGTSTSSDSFGATPSNSKHGVYEISFSKGYPSALVKVISTGNVGATQPLTIGMLRQSTGDTLSIGWQDGGLHGIDTTDFNAYVNLSYFETEIMYIAQRLPRKSFQNIEFKTGKPLVTGQSINIYARRNLKDSYKLIKTFDFATYGSVISARDKCSFVDVELMQLKGTLSQPLNTLFPNNIELITVSIW